MTTHDTQAGSARHQIVRAGHADIGVLSQVIAEAFFSLAVCRWLIPDGPARRAAFPGYFGLYVEHAIADGLVETTPDRSAAALWIPGDGPGAPPDEYAGQLAVITGSYLANFLAFDEQLDSHHPVGAFHHHLTILAVRPDRQSQGTGTALLDAHHAVLEDEGVPAYLEASDEGTRRLYLDHGYADRGSPIEFADGVRMYPMWREPRTGTAPDNGRSRGGAATASRVAGQRPKPDPGAGRCTPACGRLVPPGTPPTGKGRRLALPADSRTCGLGPRARGRLAATGSGAGAPRARAAAATRASPEQKEHQLR